MSLTHIRRQYTSTYPVIPPKVHGPLHFLKLAIQDLKVPYVYLKRTLKLSVATGASFHVQHFDVENTLSFSSKFKEYAGEEYRRGQWLVSKHIPPPSPSIMEQISADGAMDAVRLVEISVELRVLAHEPLRHHPNIVDLLAFSWDKQSDEFGRRWPFLVVENANCGSLVDFFQSADPSQRKLRIGMSLALDVANGLTALHHCGVVHGDLKPENVLIFQYPDGTIRAKISDFGSATIMSDFTSTDGEPSSILLPAYTPPWEAPEVQDAIELASLPKVDVYAFGLLFCYLITLGGNPFQIFQQTSQIVTERFTYDLDAVADLKGHGLGMIDHAIKFIASKSTLDSDEANHAAAVINMSLHAVPSEREAMSEVLKVVGGHDHAFSMESCVSILNVLCPSTNLLFLETPFPCPPYLTILPLMTCQK